MSFRDAVVLQSKPIRFAMGKAKQELTEQIEELEARIERLETKLAKLSKAKSILVGDDAYIEINSAADYMGISRRSLYRLMTQGVIPYTYIGAQRRFLVSDLNKYLKKQRVDIKGSILQP